MVGNDDRINARFGAGQRIVNRHDPFDNKRNLRIALYIFQFDKTLRPDRLTGPRHVDQRRRVNIDAESYRTGLRRLIGQQHDPL